MKALLAALLAGVVLMLSETAWACLWDSDTLSDEKSKSPKLAEAILGKAPDLGDPTKLRKRIAELESNRRENEPAWWNDLAGAYVRLGESQKAATLLESVLSRFPDDYGVHANLGTAYHLLGRYADAEKEIARDLEINPDAHFGLEKYHLALLQYLTRDAKYRARHVYVDEFTAGFLNATHGLFYFSEREEEIFKVSAQDYTNGVSQAEADYEATRAQSANDPRAVSMALGIVAALDSPPAYRSKWNLAQDTKLQDGVVYMASLNPKEPACFVMLGIVSWKQRDLNLAAAAFEKAIQLGSPQAQLLKAKREAILDHVHKARGHQRGMWMTFVVACAVAIGLFFLIRLVVRTVVDICAR